MTSSHPQFSVIIPLQHDREIGPSAVASWLAQTLAPPAYEIVLVTPNPQGRWESKLQAALRPHDQFLKSADGAETLLWDHGARQARGHWLLFTEAHCLADPSCLEEMTRYLQDHSVAGACCRSIGIAHSPAARIDERLFQQGFAQAIQPDNWRKLVMHGSVLNRRIYLELGGFEGRFGRFGEWVLERRLHDAGHRLGYAPRSIVRHVFRDSLRELIPQLASYTAGECMFSAEQSPARVADCTCFPAEWRTGHEPNTRLARAVASVLARSCWRDLWRGKLEWSQLKTAGAGGLRWGLFGQRMRAGAAWWTMQWSLLRAWRQRSDESTLEPAYRQLHEAIVRWARLRCLARHASRSQVLKLAPGRISITDIADDSLIGFHCQEKHAQGPFRWTRAVAGLEFQLTPGDYQLVLRTGGLRGRIGPLLRDVYFNGIRIPGQQLADDADDPIIPLAAQQFSPHQPQRLVVVTQPMYPARQGVSDQRELGLPLLAIELIQADSRKRLDGSCPLR